MSALIMGLAVLALSLVLAALARARLRWETFEPGFLLLIPQDASRALRKQSYALAKQRGYRVTPSRHLPPNTCYIVPAKITMDFIQPERPMFVQHETFERRVGQIMMNERLALTVQRPQSFAYISGV